MQMIEYFETTKRINNINLKERTRLIYEYCINKYILPHFENVEIMNIDTNSLQLYLNMLVTKNLSTNTIKLVWRLIKFMAKDIKLDINWDDIIIPHTHEKQVDAFCLQEQKKIENKLNIDKSPKHIGILLALYMGLRLGETLALKWEDIDFDNKLVKIKRTVYIKGGELTYSTPKTKSSIRTIPLPAFLEKMLKNIKNKSNCEFVVCQKGKPITPRTYQHFFKSLQLKAEVTKVKGFHSLRHTFATRALECGIDIKSLADILGHKNPNVTLIRYAHSMLDYKKQIMNKIGKLHN